MNSKKFQPHELRKTIVEMAYSGSTVHIACAFSIVEILAVLYRTFLSYPNNDPEAEFRDYFVLSKGHGVMAQYACMREMQWLDTRDIKDYCKDGTLLKGLSDSKVRGLEVTSGSLGHGFSVGVGIAIGLKYKKSSQKVYALLGDGELNEGSIWEGLLVAAHHKLDNLLLIVDVNGHQAMGTTDEVLALGDLGSKFLAFGFNVVNSDGHNEDELENGIRKLWGFDNNRPNVLLAKTVKGKGLPYMENDNRWHYTRLNDQLYVEAMKYLSDCGVDE